VNTLNDDVLSEAYVLLYELLRSPDAAATDVGGGGDAVQ
jgi:uncharacterized MnhB-related membrane protein